MSKEMGLHKTNCPLECRLLLIPTSLFLSRAVVVFLLLEGAPQYELPEDKWVSEASAPRPILSHWAKHLLLLEVLNPLNSQKKTLGVEPNASKKIGNTESFSFVFHMEWIFSMRHRIFNRLRTWKLHEIALWKRYDYYLSINEIKFTLNSFFKEVQIIVLFPF